MARGHHGGAAVDQGLARCFPMAPLMSTAQPINPYDPMANEPVIRTPKSASDLTLEQLTLIRDNTAGTISEILNRFSEETGLKVESVDLHIAVTYGGPRWYSATLDVRL